MPQLFISNVPWNCDEPELRQVFESKGFGVDSIRFVRDLVTHVSPAFAYVTLHDGTLNAAAIKATHGQKLKSSILKVQEDRRRSPSTSGKRRTSDK